MEQAIDAYVYRFLLVFCCIISTIRTGEDLRRYRSGTLDIARNAQAISYNEAVDSLQGDKDVDRRGAMADYTFK